MAKQLLGKRRDCSLARRSKLTLPSFRQSVDPTLCIIALVRPSDISYERCYKALLETLGVACEDPSSGDVSG